jgi:hypothetical protein
METPPPPENKSVIERSPLPLTREVAQQTLAEIAKNPSVKSVHYKMQMDASNPVLSTNLPIIARSWDAGTEYFQGSVWAYAMLHNQAIERGGRVPRISTDNIRSYLYSQMEIVKEEQPMWEENERLKARLIQDEPELAHAMLEIAKYSPNQDEYVRGAGDVYYIIKGALEAERLGKQFSI